MAPSKALLLSCKDALEYTIRLNLHVADKDLAAAQVA